MMLSLLLCLRECGCVLLQRFYAQCLEHFQMQNMPTWYLYTVSEVTILQLLQQNVGSDIHVVELLIIHHLQKCTEF
jgi:hypothetical protein